VNGILIDLTGRRFGRWLVKSRAERSDSRGNAYWNCVCACGTVRVVAGFTLRTGGGKSCGCGPKRERKDKQDDDLRAYRAKARAAANHAIRDGRLTRLPCLKCGRIPAEAHHHHGYDRAHWLDVIFLCEEHHES
jgi:hypothetical protein